MYIYAPESGISLCFESMETQSVISKSKTTSEWALHISSMTFMTDSERMNVPELRRLDPVCGGRWIDGQTEEWSDGRTDGRTEVLIHG